MAFLLSLCFPCFFSFCHFIVFRIKNFLHSAELREGWCFFFFYFLIISLYRTQRALKKTHTHTHAVAVLNCKHENATTAVTNTTEMNAHMWSLFLFFSFLFFFPPPFLILVPFVLFCPGYGPLYPPHCIVVVHCAERTRPCLLRLTV